MKAPWDHKIFLKLSCQARMNAVALRLPKYVFAESGVFVIQHLSGACSKPKQ